MLIQRIARLRLMNPVAVELCLEPCRKDIDHAISRINGRNKLHLGFSIDNNHNGSKAELTKTVKLNQQDS